MAGGRPARGGRGRAGVGGVTGHGISASIDAQRRAWQLATEFVEQTDAAAANLGKMLTAEVGHTKSEVVYEENTLELHRYEPSEVAHETPICIVYALVNRPYILDLQPDRSVIRRLLEAGFEVYLIDWGEPSLLDRTLTMRDYVGRYLDNCVDAALAAAGVEDLHLLGYCMGGSMAVMYTALDDAKVRTLGLMATPLAFEDTGGILERWATHFDPDVAVDTLGNMPADLLAVEFSLMDPVEHYITKYVRLYRNIGDPAFVQNFARMERWIWDGVDVAGETFREFIGEIYKGNMLVDGEFEIDGERVDLANVEVPVLQIVGQYDHIVPPASSTPLHDQISSSDQRLIEFPAGHIGISVSSTAHEDLWPEVCDWYAARSPRDRDPTRREAGTAPGGTAGADDVESARAAVEAVARQTAAAAATAGPETDGLTDVRSVDGIGPTYADRLAAAGIETTVDLAAHDAADLAAIAETSPGRAAGWLEQVA